MLGIFVCIYHIIMHKDMKSATFLLKRNWLHVQKFGGAGGIKKLQLWK